MLQNYFKVNKIPNKSPKKQKKSHYCPRKTSGFNVSVQKLPFGQLLGDGFCVTKCFAFWTQEPSPRIRTEVTLAYYRGTVPKYEKHKRFSYIETVPKAATPRVAFDTRLK